MDSRAGLATASAKVQVDVIYAALRMLASANDQCSARQAAARDLIAQLRLLVRAWRGSRRWLPYTIPDWLVEDVVQHVAFMASTGNARFRGTHPREAVSWCTKVCGNFVVSEWRWRSRFGLGGDTRRAASRFDSGESDVLGAATPNQELHLALTALCDRARTHLASTRRPRAASSLFDAVCCYLENVTGVPLDRQLERWCSTWPMARSLDRVRARNRLYQYHRRGRAVLLEVARRTA